MYSAFNSVPEAPPPKIPEKKENLLSKLKIKTDDLLLIIIIAVLILNECDDTLLILALVYIFLSEYIG